MSFGTTGQIPDRFRIDYAPTGRAACKTCGSSIGQGTLRIGEQVRSRFHDGFEIHFSHFRCASHKPRSFHELRGVQRLRWHDQLTVGRALHPNTRAAPPAESARLQRLSEMLWEIKPFISIPKKAMLELLEVNGIFCSEKTPPASLLHTIADGLLCGKLPPCPWCASPALEAEGTLVQCYGYVNGATRCAFAASAADLFGAAAAPRPLPAAFAREGAWRRTPAVERALKAYRLPADAPVLALGEARRGEEAGGGESASEEEADVPMDRVMAGMSFACVGSTAPPAAELQALVEARGGEWVKGGLGNGACITHLIATEAEARKSLAKRSAKFQAAVDAKVPIVSAEYVLALASVSPAAAAAAAVPSAAAGSKRKVEVIELSSDEEEAEDLTRLKVAELRRRLAEEGKDAAGSKAELVARLRRAAPAAPRSSKAASAPPSGALCGASLRQRKHLSPFLLLEGGARGHKLPPTTAAPLSAKPPPPKPRKLLPPIAAGSALLAPSREAGLGAPRVYVDEYNLAYNCTLNQMDIRTGVNKFYKMQLLVHTKAAHYAVWKSWGRVGGEESGDVGCAYRSGGRGGGGADMLVHMHGANLEAAKKEFHDKFRELARVAFVDAEPPCQHPGGYAVSLLPGQLGADAAEAARGAAAARVGADRARARLSSPPSALPEGVRWFIEQIFSEKMMKEHLQEQNIDLDKMPLGSISDVQIRRGYAILTDLADALQRPSPSHELQAQRLLALTNAFYNAVPHKFARRDTPPVIATIAALRAKLDMIESLLQISKATRISSQFGEGSSALHPADAQYAQLGCELSPADAEEVAMVKAYAANTHAATHSSYTARVKHVFRAARKGEATDFAVAVGNRQLLWHGSRLTNWVGILSQGLRIAPPEAPATGYMFGKGVYFADMFSKSANYCMATSDSSTAVLVLCEVALGEQYELIRAEYEAKENSEKQGKQSTFGIGKTCPDPAGSRKLPDGTHVPMGKGAANRYLQENLERLQKENNTKDPALLYNEFIVYDTSQIRMKYVVVFDLDFVTLIE